MRKLLLPMCAALLPACSSMHMARDWQPVPRELTVARPVVPAYEVEFLPVVPTIPGTMIVGSFRILNNAVLRYDNEEYLDAIKQKAARMGGNTIVYPQDGVTEAVVAYVPLEEVNYHGGDEALLESGVLTEDF